MKLRKGFVMRNVCGDNVIVGSASYEQWEKTILELMQ